MQIMGEDALVEFVRESNWIENITREPTEAELEAHRDFLDVSPSVHSLCNLVMVCAGEHLRDRPFMNVQVGNHVAPPGGPEIPIKLQAILDRDDTPWGRHVAYETLHPFMDGNGRSGRALWLHDMLSNGVYNPRFRFLRAFYYQTLSGSRR